MTFRDTPASLNANDVPPAAPVDKSSASLIQVISTALGLNGGNVGPCSLHLQNGPAARSFHNAAAPAAPYSNLKAASNEADR